MELKHILLPKKKYLSAGDQLEDDWLVDPKKEGVLDSSAQRELAEYWKETIRLRANGIRHFTDLARDMEKEAFKFLRGDE